MADRYSAKVGLSFTLRAQFSLAGVAANVHSITKVEIQNASEETLATITSVTALGAGLYQVTVPALSLGGTFADVWYYKATASSEEVFESFEVVVADVVATSGDAVVEASEVPAAGEAAVCLVTGRFFDAGGSHFQGVFVRFTPNQITDQVFASGMIAREVTQQSDADGLVSMYLMRGIRGTLTISGLGISREVTIPNTGMASLFELFSGTDDPLEVQQISFVTLPRSS